MNKDLYYITLKMLDQYKCQTCMKYIHKCAWRSVLYSKVLICDEFVYDNNCFDLADFDVTGYLLYFGIII